MDIAIQGISGCFHEIAAYKYFGEREPLHTIACHSFSQIFKALHNNKALTGIIAIENTVAGTLLFNYSLLRNSPFTITGEVYQRIQHNLLVANGETIKDLREVHSHPMAIKQCQQFFKQHEHIKLVESTDTAYSAKQISQQKQFGIGAIASSLAGNYYKLHTLAESIEDEEPNFTRFLIIQHPDTIPASKISPNKASISFNLSHQVGALAKILTQFAHYQLNLTKIQSLPIVGTPWEYYFHADIEFTDYNNYTTALQKIKNYIKQLHILGEYQSGLKYRQV